MRKIMYPVLASLLIVVPVFASLDDMPIKPKPKPQPQPPPPVTVMPATTVSPTTPIEPVPACDYKGLTVTLALDRDFYRPGDDIYPTITIKCTWDYHRLFNPFFNQLTEVPGRVRVFDESGKFVTQYLDHLSGSHRAPSEEDSVSVRGGGFVGTQLHFHLLKDAMADQPFSPGTYRMQVVLFDTLLSYPAAFRQDQKGLPKVIAASPLVPFLVGPREAGK